MQSHTAAAAVRTQLTAAEFPSMAVPTPTPGPGPDTDTAPVPKRTPGGYLSRQTGTCLPAPLGSTARRTGRVCGRSVRCEADLRSPGGN